MRPTFPPLLCALLLGGGCTCGKPSTGTAPSPAADGARAVSAPRSADAGGLAVFSAPIAAARVAGQDVVAGLVAAEGVLRVVAVAGGAATWTVDALRDVAWSPDAELHVQPTPGGIALVWRGPHGGRSSRTLVLLGPHGEAKAPPAEVGAALCLTDDGLAWIEPRSSGASRVMGRAWADPAARSLATLAADRDPALVCADHDVIVLGDGDDDSTATTLALSAATSRPPVVLVRDADFGDDEEREHDAYSFGDDLGIVRVASGGALALRELPRGGAPGPWRKLTHAIPVDDDVVAVDGDASSTLVVYTHDAGTECPGIASAAASVHAVRVIRKTGEEAILDLAPADCARAPGPFWIAAAPAGPVVGWAERKSGAAQGSAPVAGAVFRLLTATPARPSRVDVEADALVDGGCDARGCSVAALLRPPGADGMTPETIGVYPYP